MVCESCDPEGSRAVDFKALIVNACVMVLREIMYCLGCLFCTLSQCTKTVISGFVQQTVLLFKCSS